MMSQIVFHGDKFEISHEELDDILKEITDEFFNLEYEVESSLQSSLIYDDVNSFVVCFNEKIENDEFPNVLYYLEPKIFNLIESINSQLKEFNLYISASDFGQTDAFYELVITRIGTTPVFRPRYQKTLENSSASATSGGMGAVASPGVSSTSVASSTSGSGDVTFTLLSKPSQKMGGPSEVSDLRYLKKVKIKRVKDF